MKTKKIDCWKNLTGETSEHFVTALQFDDEKSYKEAVRYFKESFEFALTQQRIELLEEIKTRIDTWGGFEDDGGNLCHYDSEILEWVKNLLNKKDE